MKPGRFITFEGIDGAGKSTHIGALQDWARAHGREVVLTREPGGSPLAEQLRELVLHQPMDALSESLLIFAARRDEPRGGAGDAEDHDPARHHRRGSGVGRGQRATRLSRDGVATGLHRACPPKRQRWWQWPARGRQLGVFAMMRWNNGLGGR